MFAFFKNGKVVYTELVVRKYKCCNLEQAAAYVT
jgi:hypothetical protein